MAILVDYSGIATAAMFSQPGLLVEEGLVRHMILNSLRMYNVKFRAKYGQMIICCDGGSWRRDVFPQYKQKRHDSKESDSSIDWDAFYSILNKVRDELKQFLPFKVIHAYGFEADDIIATLVHESQEFGSHDEIMIVSSDHDFVQLQRFKNVQQFSPATKKLVKLEGNPIDHWLTEIIRGCAGDGVPNVFSDDDTFITEGKRQTPATAKKIDALIEAYHRGGDEEIISVLQKQYGCGANWYRNLTMIDLCTRRRRAPQEYDAVVAQAAVPPAPSNLALNYLISKRCQMLIPSVQEFFPTTNMALVTQRANQLYVYEVLEKVNELKQPERRRKFLKQNQSFELRTVLAAAFNPKLVFDLPPGAPPFKRDEVAPDRTGSTMKNVVKSFPKWLKSAKVDRNVRERSFVQALESVYGKDADVLIAAKDKTLSTLYPNVTEELTREVFPELFD